MWEGVRVQCDVGRCRWQDLCCVGAMELLTWEQLCVFLLNQWVYCVEHVIGQKIAVS